MSSEDFNVEIRLPKSMNSHLINSYFKLWNESLKQEYTNECDLGISDWTLHKVIERHAYVADIFFLNNVCSKCWEPTMRHENEFFLYRFKVGDKELHLKKID